MFRFLCCVFLAAFIVGAIGCSGNGGKKPEPFPKERPTQAPPAPPKPQPSEDEIWLSQTCGQCHKTPEEQKAKLDSVKAMTTEVVEKTLREKCLPALAANPDAKFTEEDILKAIELHKKMMEKMTKKAGETTPSAGAGNAPAGGAGGT